MSLKCRIIPARDIFDPKKLLIISEILVDKKKIITTKTKLVGDPDIVSRVGQVLLWVLVVFWWGSFFK